MAEKKMTKVEMFKEIRKVLTDTEQIAFIDHQIELTEKKNASKSTKPTARQSENADLGKDILASMESGKAYTITEIMKITPSIAEKPLDECSPQRVTAIVSKLVTAAQLVRNEVKGKAYFHKP